MDSHAENVRIAIVSSSFPPNVSGGISTAHYNLYRLLKKRGHTVKCFTYTDHSADGYIDGEVERYGASRIVLKLLGIFYGIYSRFLFKLERCNLAYQFPYFLESAIGAWKVGRALLVFKPDILILPDYGTPGFFIPKFQSCRTVFISHHNYLRFVDEPLAGNFSRNDALIAHKVERAALRKADVVICPSGYMKKVFMATHAFKGPVMVVPNVVDQEFIESVEAAAIRSEMSLSDGAPIVYIPSAGSDVKGARFVFDIVRRLAASYGKEIGFYLSGGVSDESVNFEKQSLPPFVKLHVPPRLDYKANVAAIKACDICISPTLLESFGMALLEANFCSLPVVAFNVGGVSDIITDGENGYLVGSKDVDSLVRISVNLLGNTDLLKNMKLTSESTARNLFGSSIIAELYEKLIFQS